MLYFRSFLFSVVQIDILRTDVDDMPPKFEPTTASRVDNLIADDAISIATSAKSSSTSDQKNSSLNVSDCDWEELFDENGDYVDESLVNEVCFVAKICCRRKPP